MRNQDPGGLCSTCVNAGFCIHLKARARGAVQCELFDQGAVVVDVERVPSLAELVAREPSAPCLGLCSTCDLVDQCMLARPQGGVWHCEEYC